MTDELPPLPPLKPESQNATAMHDDVVGTSVTDVRRANGTAAKFVVVLGVMTILVGLVIYSRFAGRDSVRVAGTVVPPRTDASRTVERFRTQLPGLDAADYIVDLSGEENTCTVTIENGWHALPYQTRLRATKELWKRWVSIHAPDDPDVARLELIDLNNNTVGGSSMFGGSMIWVQEQ